MKWTIYTPDEGEQQLSTYVSPTEVEEISIENAYGRVLAEEIVSDLPVPPYNKSPYDGFAILYAPDVSEFTIINTIGAGEVHTGTVQKYQAVRLMTGCKIPDGCDTVVMQEQCDYDDTTLRVRGVIQKGSHIIVAGEECPSHTTVIERGVCLNAGHIAVAVGVGVHRVRVYKPVKVLLLTSGREVQAIGSPLREGAIYNSNLYMLRYALEELGNVEITEYHVSDDNKRFEEELKLLKDLSNGKDIVISTGGVSVGLYDTIPKLYEHLGVHMIYNRLAMRPGAAAFGGVLQKGHGHSIWLGLSGNPSAAWNGYHLIGKPLVKRLQGYVEPYDSVITCELVGPLHLKAPVPRYVQGQIFYEAGQAKFKPNNLVTSSALIGLGLANGLGVLQVGIHELEAGDTIQVNFIKV